GDHVRLVPGGHRGGELVEVAGDVPGLRAHARLRVLLEEEGDDLLGGRGALGVAPPGEAQRGVIPLSIPAATAGGVRAAGGEGGAREGGQGQGGERGAARGD